MEHIKIPKHQHFICLLFYHHCSLNDNFYSLASSWNQIKLRNMTAIVLDKTMSTAWKNEFYIMDKTNWQSYWNHNLLIELVWKKNEFFNFFKFLVDYDNQFYIYCMNCCQLARCSVQSSYISIFFAGSLCNDPVLERRPRNIWSCCKVIMNC